MDMWKNTALNQMEIIVVVVVEVIYSCGCQDLIEYVVFNFFLRERERRGSIVIYVGIHAWDN